MHELEGRPEQRDVPRRVRGDIAGRVVIAIERAREEDMSARIELRDERLGTDGPGQEGAGAEVHGARERAGDDGVVEGVHGDSGDREAGELLDPLRGDPGSAVTTALVHLTVAVVVDRREAGLRDRQDLTGRRRPRRRLQPRRS
ncbi:hypothetical protein [Sorangium sp. So ce887]|uniref:hypothetical protein n=1 Tax=Sorangium sp. So ce887 TaxID=3133324 RepID=UPI003F632DFD